MCYYRDKNSINKFQLAKVTKDGVTVSGAHAGWRQARLLGHLRGVPARRGAACTAHAAAAPRASTPTAEPFALETAWNFKLFENPSANAPGTW